MKTFPNYDVVATHFNGDRCTVTLKAATKCGPEIEAKSTVTRKPPERGAENDVQLAKKTLEIAVRNLSHEHDVVVGSCKRRGTHNH